MRSPGVRANTLRDALGTVQMRANAQTLSRSSTYMHTYA